MLVKDNKLRVCVTGGASSAPEVIKSEKTVAEMLKKLLPELVWQHGILLHAPVGAGKTYAITHILLPWVLEQGWRMLFVSSRTAINTQVKRDITAVTGEQHFVDELTDCGWQAQSDFEGVTVLTYHALYFEMCNDPNALKKFDILVFDEIHALLEDASFVPYSGYVLNHLHDFWGTKIRLYMTATPEDILPCLTRAEAPYTLRVIRFRQSYDYVQPYFFHDEMELIRLINEDKSDQKWLVHSPSIQHAKDLRKLIHHPCCLLNSVSREQNPAEWNKMLLDKTFDEKVALASAAIDAGVSFTDKSLSNVAVFSYSPTTIVQVLGRKRRKGGETVRLFIWCPSADDVYKKRRQNSEVQEAFRLHDVNYTLWEERLILRPQALDMRDMVIPDACGHLELNPLAVVKLSNEQNFLEKLTKRARENHGDCGFDRLIVHHLRLKDVNYPQCWLDSRQNGTARADLETLIVNTVGKNMSEDEFQAFTMKFRDLCVAAYGKGRGGKDRDDRAWGYRKIDNKLREFGGQYSLKFDPVGQVYYVIEKGGELA